MNEAYIGIGSNLGDPIKQLNEAKKAIGQITSTSLLNMSRYYQSKPMVSQGDMDISGSQQSSQKQSQPDYVNAVAHISTGLLPLELLAELQAIEQLQGRVREKGEHWGARTIDLDILLFADKCIRLPQLIVPHYGLEKRPFVVFPLLDLAGRDLQIPGSTSLGEIAEKLDRNELTLIDQ